MTAHDDLARRLQRIAKVSYGATIDEARDVSRALNEAVAVIEQQADRIAALTANCGLLAASLDKADRDIAALQSDIESQIQLTREAMELAAGYRKDAERYRHLRECNSGSLVIVQIIGTGDDDQVVLTEGDADTAIDAALAPEEG